MAMHTNGSHFSGIISTPAEEEGVKFCLEQAQLMIEDGKLPVWEKQKRLIESMRGPAFEMAKAVGKSISVYRVWRRCVHCIQIPLATPWRTIRFL